MRYRAGEPVTEVKENSIADWYLRRLSEIVIAIFAKEKSPPDRVMRLCLEGLFSDSQTLRTILHFSLESREKERERGMYSLFLPCRFELFLSASDDLIKKKTAFNNGQIVFIRDNVTIIQSTRIETREGERRRQGRNSRYDCKRVT